MKKALIVVAALMLARAFSYTSGTLGFVGNVAAVSRVAGEATKQKPSMGFNIQGDFLLLNLENIDFGAHFGGTLIFPNKVSVAGGNDNEYSSMKLWPQIRVGPTFGFRFFGDRLLLLVTPTYRFSTLMLTDGIKFPKLKDSGSVRTFFAIQHSVAFDFAAKWFFKQGAKNDFGVTVGLELAIGCGGETIARNWSQVKDPPTTGSWNRAFDCSLYAGICWNFGKPKVFSKK